MGKPKKGSRQDDDFDSDNDDVGPQQDTQSQNAGQPAKKADKKKNKKKGKQKDDDDWGESESKTIDALADIDDMDEDIPVAASKKNKNKKKGMSAFAMLAEMDGDDDGNDDFSDNDMEEEAPVVSKKSKGKAKGTSAFAMLSSMDDGNDMGDDDFDDNKSDAEEDSVKEDVSASVKEDVSAQKSKKKEKTKKSKKKDDEDIDAILADIEKPTSKADKKKKKNKKGDAEEEEVVEVAENNEEERVETTKSEKKKKKKNKGGDAEEEEEGENKDGEVETPVIEVEKMENKVVTIDDLDDDYFEDEKKRKKKNKKKDKDEEATQESKAGGEADDAEGEEWDEFKMKSAAQKKKEKKEREKQRKLEEKQKEKKKEQAKKEKEGPKDADGGKSEKESQAVKAAPEADEQEGEGKKKKKKKAEKEEKKEEKSKPKNKQIAALREALRIQKEEEQLAKKEMEQFRLEEEERIRKIEEEEKLREEAKLKKKEAKREREAQLKKEGKWLTAKQRQDRQKVEQMLEAMKLSGVEVGPRPVPEKTTKHGFVYTKKKRHDNKEKSPTDVTTPTEGSPEVEMKESMEGAKKEVEVTIDDKKKEVEEEVKDAWDAESEEEDEKKDAAPERSTAKPVAKKKVEEEEEEDDDEEEDEDEDESESEEESSEEDSDESESESEEESTPIDRGREKALKRAEKAEKAKTLDHLRAPVVCVLGHVDTGKTKILDKLRRTNVQDGEAGGITQQIGATNVPKDAIVEKTKMVKEFAKQDLKIPGLLIIDTPGHESFSNLRIRGSSLCDIAILVIDIMHGLEPQTKESINLLKERKTPFLVALNKVDRLYQWKPQPMNDVQNTVKKQSAHTKSEFDERTQDITVQLAEEGLNAALFYENKNQREYVSMVPTSAHTGDGMGNLVALVCELCQNMLAKRLMYSSDLQATVMEVKAITGMGTTVDVILINGALHEGDTIVLAGTDGPIVTQIRGLLMPQPMKELRVKSQYEHHKTVMAAQGIKINAKEMEKALAGLPLFVAHDADEKEYYKDEVAIVLKDTLESIKVQEKGVFVQASTLGSLEALLEFLRTSKIPYAGINIGPVHKKDIMRASVMLEHDSQYAVILAFDVKIERDAQELADSTGVRIFTADIIYHLFDAFMKYRDDCKRQKQEEFKHIAVFPCKLKILPQYVFNSRDPIVMGVIVEAGFVKDGTPICVPTKEFVDIGRIGSLEVNHKQVDVAKQGQEVCIKILPIPGEAPKMYGRHFEDADMLVSKISRQSIDAVKDYFRDEMTKQDWKLMVELKKEFAIL